MAIITVYKMGQSMQINDFDLSAWSKKGWSKTQSSAPSPTTPTPRTTPAPRTPTTRSTTPRPPSTTPSPAPSPAQSTTMKVYKNGQSIDIYSSDLQSYINRGWSKTQSSPSAPAAQPSPAPSPTPSPAPATSTASPEAPPAGSTYISDPKQLAGLSESQIWRDPSNGRIYKLPGASNPTQAPAAETPSQGQQPGQAPLNTVGLLEAFARRQAGTASEADIRNLDYATSKGWTPPGASSQAPAATPDSQNIPGLNTVGLPEAYARKIAGTASPTDLANLQYAESKGWRPPSVPSGVTDPQTANDIINSQQNADILAKTEGEDVVTRKSVDEIMQEIRSSITPEIEKPTAPNYEESLRDLRTEYGIDPLENNLNSLNSQLQELMARREARIASEADKTVSMDVIAGRISEVERQENERIAAIERSIQNVTNQLNTKYNVVNSLMGAKELDYKTSAAAYDAQMQQNITLFNAAQNIEESLKTEEQRAIDSARSSAQILVNAYSTAGISYDKLTPAQQSTLTKLALESGFDANFYETVLSATQEVQKDILTSITSDDKAYVTFVYKDGTTATISTGQPRAANTPVRQGPAKDTDEEKAITAFRADASKLIQQLDSNEISWGAAWDSLHVKYPDASPELLDATLGGGYDPSRPGANDQGYYGRAND